MDICESGALVTLLVCGNNPAGSAHTLGTHRIPAEGGLSLFTGRELLLGRTSLIEQRKDLDFACFSSFCSYQIGPISQHLPRSRAPPDARHWGVKCLRKTPSQMGEHNLPRLPDLPSSERHRFHLNDEQWPMLIFVPFPRFAQHEVSDSFSAEALKKKHYLFSCI